MIFLTHVECHGKVPHPRFCNTFHAKSMFLGFSQVDFLFNFDMILAAKSLLIPSQKPIQNQQICISILVPKMPPKWSPKPLQKSMKTTLKIIPKIPPKIIPKTSQNRCKIAPKIVPKTMPKTTPKNSNF